MKIDGTSGKVKWAQYGQCASAFNYNAGLPYGGFTQLGLSNGKVVMAGRFQDTLTFPGVRLFKSSVADSICAFAVQFDAATGRVMNASKISEGPGQTHVAPTLVSSDPRGNFYIGGWFNASSFSLGSTTLTNINSLNKYQDLFLGKWGIASCNCTVPAPSFSSGSQTGATRRFTYVGTTSGIDSLVWSWGDGQTQKVTTGFSNPVSHTYAVKDSTYEVCVTAFSRTCGSNQTCINAAPLLVSGVSVNGFTVYPNPTSNLLTISGAAGTEVSIYSIVGATLLTRQINSISQQLDISPLPSGVYLLSILRPSGERSTMRIAKE
jgi:hypothetical protein